MEKNDFDKTNPKTKSFTCAYSGSFSKGKGLETIYSIAKKPHKLILIYLVT